jgi:hypothetical protein
MEPLVLHFAEGRVDGEGEDCIGAFTFEGSHAEGGVVLLVKQYAGQRAVLYEGRVGGEGAVVARASLLRLSDAVGMPSLVRITLTAFTLLPSSPATSSSVIVPSSPSCSVVHLGPW